jgi:SAM-dependent methyltransferase
VTATGPVQSGVLAVLRCPLCRAGIYAEGSSLRCSGCGAVYPVEEGIPRMLDDRLPGIAAKRGEIEGWVAMAKAQGWYEPDDEVDAVLPYVCRDLDWDDKSWRANEHSFSLLLERYVQPGMRVLEVGAAKAWAAQHLVPRGVEYVATDILADPNIGLGRGAFYEARVGSFGRVQADGEHLPFADGSFDLVYCVAALHHALDLRRMVAELARATRRGGVVAALNEGTRALGASPEVEDQAEEKGFGINEHVHTLYAYLWAFARSGLVVRRVEHAEGYDDLRRRRWAGRLFRLPLVGRSAATWFSQTCHGYSGVSLFARKL